MGGYGFTYSVHPIFFLFFLLCSISSVLFCSVLFSGLINLTMRVYYHRYLSFLIVFLLRMKE